MPLDENILVQGYKDAIAAAQKTQDVDQAADVFARGLAKAVHLFILSGNVTGTVTTVGSATTQTGPLLNGKMT